MPNLERKLVTYGNSDVLERLNTQFRQIEQRINTLQVSLQFEKTMHDNLKMEYERLIKLNNEQSEELREARQQLRTLKAEHKQLREKEVSLKEKLNNFKQLSIIVKNPKNANAITELNSKLDDYIRYIEETITLLRTI